MKPIRDKRLLAETLQSLISHKLRYAELNLHTAAQRINAIHNKIGELRATAANSLSPDNFELAYPCFPHWRKKLDLEEKAFVREIGALEVEKAILQQEAEKTLKQKLAVCGYISSKSKVGSRS